MSDQSDEEHDHITDKWRRISDSDAKSIDVDESSVLPCGAYPEAKCEMAIELTTGPRCKPSILSRAECVIDEGTS